ncbi:MAG: right-handed parallel beta-helix repeat-containing protein [Bacteroidales bacterium]|jgi:parallel beta-helix repeat protein|nr:right-handed parallel beta-helix repeat-containing protein [Bacteroidales bacterium]MDD3700370.1 right-handed parallel beta-helix repeat-containing protein [Bacteroidales bacterium]MDY0368744.1 right-handed parallel beta-helix repeat-containing protein [Bacteroidales bacterium]
MAHKNLLLTILILTSSFVLSQNTHFVATNGSDTSGNGTINNPYATLQHALWQCTAGDTIVMRGGNYTGHEIRIDLDDITIRSYENEWAVITAPIDDPDINFCIWYHKPEIIGGKLERLEIVGGYYYGIKLESNWNWGYPISERRGVSNITIKNCIIHDTGRDCLKLTPACNNLLIESCEIYNSGVGPANAGNPNAEGIDAVNCNNLTIKNCYIHDISTTGIYSKGGSVNTVVEGNLVMETGANGILLGFYTDEEWFDPESNPILYENIDGIARNNIVINTDHAGIGLYAAKNPRVYNNTVINAAREAHAALFMNTGYIWVEALNDMYAPPCSDVFVFNNIFSIAESTNRPIAQIRYYENDINSNMLGDCEIDYNIYYRQNGVQFDDGISESLLNFADWKTATGFDTNSLDENPDLDANYHLNSSSPAVDNGFAVESALYDYDGCTRTEPYDIGADEFNCGSILVIPPPEGVIGTGADFTTTITELRADGNFSVHLFPNPSQDLINFELYLRQNADIHIEIRDLSGRVVKKVFSGNLNGLQNFEINTKNFVSGIYFINLQTDNNLSVYKFMIIK